MKSHLLFLTAFVSLFNAASMTPGAEPPKILELRIQVVNQKTYFHVRLQRPADLLIEGERFNRRFDPWGSQWGDPTLGTRLVPQDEAARLVYGREAFQDRFGGQFQGQPRNDFEKKAVPPPNPNSPPPSGGVRTTARKPERAGTPPNPNSPPPSGGVPDEPKKSFKEKENDFKDDRKKSGDKGKDFKGKGENNAEANALDFYGVFTGKNEATFLLLYPKDPGVVARKKRNSVRALLHLKKKPSLYDLLQEKNSWAEVSITLDPAKAKNVPMPAQGFQRDENRPVTPNDLEGNWAIAQASHFALLEAQTPEFGFYGFARETTNRIYKIRSLQMPFQPGLDKSFDRGSGGPGRDTRRLYEVTTGAAAITESLALDRLRNRLRGAQEKEEARTVLIGEVRGVDIAEHPWKKMMGDKRPAPEPLAQLVPHDNYYIHFKTITKFLDSGDLLDQWGTSVARAFEVNSRDYRIKQRLEQQICLKSTGMARVFGPAVIKSLAITGNDPYLREGSDFTMIFQVANEPLFQAGSGPALAEAKKKFGKELKEDKADYEGIAIESFITPLREVSLHRATFDGYAVYSNSAVAVRRVIDAHKGKTKRLADALDFQYMRTIFRLDDLEEDGFVFLSDAFIRNLVGPQVRIKERRRLEALTSLHMVTNGAMFTAWETGKLPQNYQHILATTDMNVAELFSPDGDAVMWDQEHKVALSSFYNTLHFATPLVEIPIGNVTPSEVRDYQMFRDQYMGLWRQFFDPIGMRLGLNKEQVRMEIYILPLVRTTQYNQLRRITGDGTVTIDSTMFSDKTLFKYLMHIAPDVFDRGVLGFGTELMADVALRSWLGDWFAVRFDDSPVYAKLLESYIRGQIFPEERHDFIDDMQLLFQVPLTVAWDVRSPLVFAGLLTAVRKAVENTLPGAVEWGPMKEPYKGTSIVRIKAHGERLGLGPRESGQLDPEFYYALVDGVFFLSLREEPIRELIDRNLAIMDRKDKGAKAEVNAMLYLGPQAAVQSKDLLRLYLEWETHRRVQLNNGLLYAMFRSNVVGPQDDSAAVEAATLHYLGFVPVSPDLAPFRYDWQKEEVVNLRHGSLRQPKLNRGVEANSPWGQMLEQFATIRADLRFREDGIHTTLTMTKKGRKGS